MSSFAGGREKKAVMDSFGWEIKVCILTSIVVLLCLYAFPVTPENPEHATEAQKRRFTRPFGETRSVFSRSSTTFSSLFLKIFVRYTCSLSSRSSMRTLRLQSKPHSLNNTGMHSFPFLEAWSRTLIRLQGGSLKPVGVEYGPTQKSNER
jgi:hypothetical protein